MLAPTGRHRHRDDAAGRREHRARDRLEQPLEDSALAPLDHLYARRFEVIVNDRVQQQLAHDDRRNPERCGDREPLQKDDRHEQDHEHAERVGENSRQRRDEQLRKRGEDRAILVAQPVVLFVIPIVHLHRMAYRSRGYQERNHEHQRVERESDQADEAEAPDRADDAGDGRPQRAAPVEKVKVQKRPHRDHGNKEDSENLRRIVVNPSIEDRLAAVVDPDRGVALGLHHDAADLIEDAAVVETRFEEAALDYRRLVIDRHEPPEDHARILVDAAPDVVDLALRGRHLALGQDGNIEDYSPGQRAKIARRRHRAH